MLAKQHAQKAIELVGQGQTEMALEALSSYFKVSEIHFDERKEWQELFKKNVLLSAGFNKLKEQGIYGLTSTENAKTGEVQLNHAILNLAFEIKNWEEKSEKSQFEAGDSGSPSFDANGWKSFLSAESIPKELISEIVDSPKWKELVRMSQNQKDKDAEEFGRLYHALNEEIKKSRNFSLAAKWIAQNGQEMAKLVLQDLCKTHFNQYFCQNEEDRHNIEKCVFIITEFSEFYMSKGKNPQIQIIVDSLKEQGVLKGEYFGFFTTFFYEFATRLDSMSQSWTLYPETNKALVDYLKSYSTYFARN
jgi:hypothetical protein